MRKGSWILFLSVATTLVAAPHLVAAQGTKRAAGNVVVDRAFDLLTSQGKRQRLLYVSPAHPRATLVMLPGGAGDVGIDGDGDVAHGDNFLVRSRDLWVAEGFAVLIPDAIGGENLRGIRSSPDYAQLVGEFVGAARQESRAPVFLFGTSQGAIAAMNGAAHLRGGEIAGVILSESVSRQGGSHETVFDAHPELVKVPALVVANSDDRCDVAPPEDAPKIAAAMPHSPAVKVLDVSGGEQRSQRACGSLSPHGYLGIEPTVVGGVTTWIKTLIK